jgi:hypothetical protein
MTDDEKIKKIQNKLEAWHFISEEDLPSELHSLRNRCIYIVSLVDALLDILIGMNISFPIKEKVTMDERFSMSDKIVSFVGPMSFHQKFDIAKKMGQVKAPLTEYIDKAVKLRSALAHPFAEKYLPVIKELKMHKSKQLSEWENLERVVDAMEELKKNSTNP